MCWNHHGDKVGASASDGSVSCSLHPMELPPGGVTTQMGNGNPHIPWNSISYKSRHRKAWHFLSGREKPRILSFCKLSGGRPTFSLIQP